MSKSSPSFIIQNGLRKILPYYQINELFVKGRWFNRTLLDVLNDEFKSRDSTFYTQEIMNENIFLVRDKKRIDKSVLLSTMLQNKDRINITVHKHEPSVLYQDEIPIIFQDENIIVINKPSSIPVHPTGKFYYNSITEQLKLQLNVEQLHPCHRLDRLTSGVLVLAKTAEVASILQTQIKDKSVEKYYLARVQGKFPKESHIVCDKPIANLDPKTGYKNAIKLKKPAVTEFRSLEYSNELDQSIVLCKPLTGRTHQIRIHLNYLGHPILNDPLYGPNCSPIRKKYILNDDFEANYGLKESDFNILNIEFKTGIEELKTSKVCPDCGEVEYFEQRPENLILWLHAFKYKFNQYEFRTDQPKWCNF